MGEYPRQYFRYWDVTYSDGQGGQSGEGNIDEEPKFTFGGDYYIMWSSPCVDASIELDLYRDLDGDPRPLGDGFDMGADEANPLGPGILVFPASQYVFFLTSGWIKSPSIHFPRYLASHDYPLDVRMRPCPGQSLATIFSCVQKETLAAPCVRWRKVPER